MAFVVVATMSAASLAFSAHTMIEHVKNDPWSYVTGIAHGVLVCALVHAIAACVTGGVCKEAAAGATSARGQAGPPPDSQEIDLTACATPRTLVKECINLSSSTDSTAIVAALPLPQPQPVEYTLDEYESIKKKKKAKQQQEPKSPAATPLRRSSRTPKRNTLH